VDLDSCYGTVSTYLGIDGKYGIADVLAYEGQIDRHLIRSSACAHMDDFHVLASPAGMRAPKTRFVKYENLIDVMGSCRQVYEYTVVDAPRIAKNVIQQLAGVSGIVLIVFQLTIKDVKFTKSLITELIEAKVKPEKIMLLVNRFKKRNSVVSLEDWQKVLGVDRLHKIRSDWKKAANCINSGHPLADVAPRSGLRRDYRKLAEIIYSYHTNGNGQIKGG